MLFGYGVVDLMMPSHIDVAVRVAGPMTTEHSDAIKTEIKQRLHSQFDGLEEVQVEFAPRRDAPPDYDLIARSEAARLGVSVHEVIAVKAYDGLRLKMHVEVDPSLNGARRS